MFKTQLIDIMATQTKMPKTQTKKALDSLIDITSISLKKGDNVWLFGLGTLSIQNKPERQARNPRTGNKINIAAKKVVKFKAANDLKKKINTK
ncbi:MAG: HU family DNA-binding protein [Bacteroidota bacterium]|nr:HU family DNA-binding protein [Bacteroidota bacterium]